MSYITLLEPVIQRAGTDTAQAYLYHDIEKEHTAKKEVEITNWIQTAGKECELMIRAAIQQHFPHHTIDGEELGREEKNSEYTWYIDPMSSTDNFIKELPHFAIVVGLWHATDGPVFGAVYDPFMKEVFIAEKDGGVFLNNEPIVCLKSKKEGMPQVGLIHIRAKTKKDPHEWERWRRIYETFLKDPNVQLRYFGSMGIHLAYVAAGRLDFVLSSGVNTYGCTGGAIVAMLSGAVITDSRGKPWSPHSDAVVAAIPGMHPSILRVVKRSLQVG